MKYQVLQQQSQGFPSQLKQQGSSLILPFPLCTPARYLLQRFDWISPMLHPWHVLPSLLQWLQNLGFGIWVLLLPQSPCGSCVQSLQCFAPVFVSAPSS